MHHPSNNHFATRCMFVLEICCINELVPIRKVCRMIRCLRTGIALLNCISALLLSVLFMEVDHKSKINGLDTFRYFPLQ